MSCAVLAYVAATKALRTMLRMLIYGWGAKVNGSERFELKERTWRIAAFSSETVESRETVFLHFDVLKVLGDVC